MNLKRRVVITGLGVISSIGIGWGEFWKNIIKGKSGIKQISSFDTSMYGRHLGGEVANFRPEQFIERRALNYLGRASQFTIAAIKLGIKDAQIDIKKCKSEVGVCLGTTMGESQVIEQIVKHTLVHSKTVKRSRLLLYPANNLSNNVAKYFRFTNVNILFANACAAGNYAVSYAYDLIRSEKVNFVIAGGADALSRISLTGFGRMFAMADDKCRPFDRNRKGILIGEGAGIVILESLESALKRKAKIYAEVLGHGMSCDAYHMTDPSVNGIVRSVKRAIENSKIKKNRIDYISAHGTGTKENDKAECVALKKIFGKNMKKIPMSSIKSMLGHTMGAASAFETIICCLAMKYSKLPPTINYQTFDPECDIDCVPNKYRKQESKIVLNNSQAFGGNNACLILRKINDLC